VISHRHFSIASRIGVSITVPELERDIDAQILALADDDHPKRAVFLARGNAIGDRKLPSGLFVEGRREGTLITTDPAMALYFRNAEYVTDFDLAAMLSYPEAKADVLLSDEGVVVQAMSADGCVIYEAAASPARHLETVAVAQSQMPTGGKVVVTTPQAALHRRIARMH
jgi:hypothetical protein